LLRGCLVPDVAIELFIQVDPGVASKEAPGQAAAGTAGSAGTTSTMASADKASRTGPA